MTQRRTWLYLGTKVTGTGLMQSSASHLLARRGASGPWEIHVDGPDFPDGPCLVDVVESGTIAIEVADLGYDLTPDEWQTKGLAERFIPNGDGDE